ncbi:MAG: CHAD domain-containing protein, partial [Maioricimonas sp. JB049]
LVERRERIQVAGRPVGMTLDELVDALRDQRQQVAAWSLEADGFDAIAGGLGKTFGRGIKALKRARESRTDEDLHDWRKRVKYHWYHCRLLRELWPQMLMARIHELDRLSDLLGDDHDLAVLNQTISDTPGPFGDAVGPFGDAATRAALRGRIEQRRRDLQRQAFDLGHRVYAESAKRLTQRFEAWWNVWHATK